MIPAGVHKDEDKRLACFEHLKLLGGPEEARFDRITNLVCKTLNVPISAVSLIERDTQFFKSIQGLEGTEAPREITFCSHTILSDEVMHIPDALEDDRFRENPFVIDEPHIRSYLGVPISVTPGLPVATLSAIDTKPRTFTDNEIQILKDFADIVVSELTSFNINGEMQRLIMNSAHDYIFIKDSNFRIVQANEKFIHLYPKEKQNKVIGYTTVEEYRRAEREKFLEQDKIALKEGHAETTEEILCPDGQLRIFETKKVRFEDVRGDQYILGLAKDVSSQKRFEKELKSRNDLLLRAENIAHIGHWSLDMRNEEIFWSDEIYNIHGVTKDTYKPVYETAVQFYHPDDIEMVEKAIEKAVTEREEFLFEARLIQPNGDTRHVLSSGECDYNDYGEPVFLFGVFQDITNLKKSQKRLKDSEERYKLATQGAQIGVWDWDLLRNEVSFNDQWFNMLGYASDDMPNRFETFEKLCHPDDLLLVKDKLESRIEGHSKDYQAVIRMKHKDGHWVWVSTTGQITDYDSQGNAIRLSGIHMDISDLKNAQDALAISEEQFRLGMEYSPIGKAYLAPDGKWLKVNKALTAMLGYTQEEFLELDFQTITHHEDLEADLEQMEKVLSGEIDNYFIEKRYIHKRGYIIYGLLSVALIRNEDGSPKYFISQIQDITERKRAEEQLKQANEELEEFAYRTSHDLRSPLISSQKLVEFSREMIQNGEIDEAGEYLKHVQDAMKKLEILVNDILDLTQIKNQEEEDQPIDVRIMVDDALSKFSHMDNFEQVYFDINIDSNIVPHTKASRFRLIAENLISNAIKYQDLNKEKPTIKIGFKKRGKNYLFTVEDNGIGIPKEHQETLFMMFKRYHPRKAYGSGLGLYMVKKSADIMRSQLNFIDLGDGSRFELVMPLS